MRILQTLYHCQTGGGSLQVVQDLATAARQSGHEVDILLPQRSLFQGAGELFFTGHKFLDWFRFWQRLQANVYDLVHVHDRYCSLLLRGIPHRPPSVQTNHTLYTTHPRLTLLADRVVACSQTMDHHHATFFKVAAARRRYIPNGVHQPLPSLQRLHQLQDQIPSHLRSRDLCVTVARLSPQKGHTYLLQAIAQLPENLRQQWAFVFAGSGDLQLSLQLQAIDLGINDTIIWLGHTTDIAEWLTLASVFVLPSLFEGLPLSLLEAMAMGLPCLVSAVDGNLDVIRHGENGWVCPPAAAAALAQHLASLLHDPDLRSTLGHQAQQDYHRYWSFERTWDQYQELYFELCSNPSCYEAPYVSSVS